MQTRGLLSSVGVMVATALMAVAGHTLVVARVHAGDRIEFEGGWITRILGIAAPGVDDPVGREALRFVRECLDGRRVAVFTWTTDNTAAGIVHDEEGLPFAEIGFGEDEAIDLGARLLALGLARVDGDHLPAHLVYYREIEAEARAARRGIWRVAP